MEKEEVEKTGRIYLWISAISECRSLLDLAEKSERAGLKISKEAAELKSEGKPQKNNHAKEFGAYPDLLQTTQCSRMLAIVLFSQIIRVGNRHSNAASKNDKEFLEKVFNPCLSKVFPAVEEREKFDLFLDQVLAARDGVIGHADAKLFNIKHDKQMSSLNMHSKSLENIDFDYWRIIIEPIYRELFNQLPKKS